MQTNDGAIIGQKGVKYGLQKPVLKAAGGPPATARRPANVFGDESDEEDVEAQIKRQADKKRAAAKVQQQYEAALAEDASVFDYDGVYDSLQQQKVQPRQEEKIERKSRYIAQLKDQAERRKKEDDIAFERKQLKDRVKEDHLFEGKEVFVTGAYRRKLEEQKKWLEDEKRKEEEEARQDVRKNVAFGTAEVQKSEEEGKKPDSERAGGASGPVDNDDDDDQGLDDKVAKEKKQAELVAMAAKAGVHLDKYDLLRMEAEKALKGRARAAGAAAGTSETAAEGAAAAEAAEEAEAANAPLLAAAVESKAAEAAEAAVAEAAAAAAEVAQVAAGKRRNDDSAVMSARERYLARKKQHV